MKKLLTLAAAPALMLALAVPAAHASEKEHFREAVEQAIGPIVREEVDKAIEDTEHLVKQATKIVAEAAHEFHDKERKLLEIISSNADTMLGQSPEAFEEAWQHGEALHDQGIDLHDFDHFSPVMAYFDMLVHPAAAHSLLKAYKSNGDHHQLEQAREELAELLEHEEGEGDSHGGGHGGGH